MKIRNSILMILFILMVVILVSCGKSSNSNKQEETSSTSTSSTQSESSYDKEHHLKPFNQLSLNEYIQRLNSDGETAKNENGNITDTMNRDTVLLLDSSGKIAKSMSKRTVNNLYKTAGHSHDTINQIKILDSKTGDLIAISQNGNYQYFGLPK